MREILTSHRVPIDKQTGEMRISCDVAVNCLGAWSPVFSAKIGTLRMPVGCWGPVA